MNDFPLLTAITLTPLLGAALVIGLGQDQKWLARKLAFGFSVLSLVFALLLCWAFNTASGQLQFVETHAWIPTLGINYHLGVDGLGVLMVLLTALIVPMAMAVSWRCEERVSLHCALMLFLQAGLFGAFTAQNFFHWFLFYELSLIPAFFLVKFWGGPRASAAATQFFIYTMVGSVALLLAFLALFRATGTFDFLALAELARTGALQTALHAKLGWHGMAAQTVAGIIFCGALLGFAVKVPLMPFHTWLPATYAEAPTSTAMLLTGLMSKLGVYGFLRILLPIFPEQMRVLLTPLLWLAVVTIVFSACAAFAQRDLKRVLAYSSINHLGYCLLGIFAAAQATGADAQLAHEKAAALNGVLLQMFNHGLTAAALFAFVGFLEQRGGGQRGLYDFGGLRQVAPVFCGLMGIALFASLGLPGLNGFIGEFLIFKGVFPLTPWAAALATPGLLVTAIFILTLLQRVFNGPLNERWKALPDLTLGERCIVVPAIVLMFVLGLWPQPVIALFNATVLQMVKHLTF